MLEGGEADGRAIPVLCSWYVGGMIGACWATLVRYISLTYTCQTCAASQGICMQLIYVTDLRVLPILVSVSCTMSNSLEIYRKWPGCSLSFNLISCNIF